MEAFWSSQRSWLDCWLTWIHHFFFKTPKAVHKSQWILHPLLLQLPLYGLGAQLPPQPELPPSTCVSSQNPWQVRPSCVATGSALNASMGSLFLLTYSIPCKAILSSSTCSALLHCARGDAKQLYTDITDVGVWEVMTQNLEVYTVDWGGCLESWSKPVWNWLPTTEAGEKDRARMRNGAQEFTDTGGSASSQISVHEILSAYPRLLLEPK